MSSSTAKSRISPRRSVARRGKPFGRSRHLATNLFEQPGHEGSRLIVLVAIDMTSKERKIVTVAASRDTVEIGQCAARSREIEVAQRRLETLQHRPGLYRHR